MKTFLERAVAGEVPDLQEGINEAVSAVERASDRADKPWPVDEDCPGCPGHRDGPHKMACSVHPQQIKYVDLSDADVAAVKGTDA